MKPRIVFIIALSVVVIGTIIAYQAVSSAKSHSDSSTPDSSSTSPSAYQPSTPSTPSNNFGPNGKLEPTVIGGTQCEVSTLSDGSSYAQVALAGGATCDQAESVAQDASGKNGADYTSNAYSCKATKQGGNTQWSSYWNNNFYSYSCSKGSDQVAFNWQSAAQASQSSSSTTNLD